MRAHILVACMPKSGSSLLSAIFANLPDFRRAQLIPEYDRREQELDEFCVREADRFNYVAQHHVRYSAWTARLCRDYGVTPIVLVRDLPDLTVSLRDALRRDGPLWPFLFAEDRHTALPDAELEEMIVRLAMPWFVNFYMSWRAAPDAHWIQYRDLIADPAGVAARALEVAGVFIPRPKIEAAVALARGADTRFNVGVVGRGARLSPKTARSLVGLFDYYPEAAADAYVVGMRQRAAAAIQAQPAGRPSPTKARRAPRFAALRRWVRRTGARVAVRGLAPIGLVVASMAYWLWPHDLIDDAAPFGRLDDIVVLVVLCLVAGRLTTFKPGIGRLRPPQSLVGRPAPPAAGPLV